MVQKGGKSHGIEKHAVRNIKLPPELRALTFARALVTSLPFAYLQEKVGYALFGVSSLFIIFLWRTLDARVFVRRPDTTLSYLTCARRQWF
jgi:hypothetical protein